MERLSATWTFSGDLTEINTATFASEGFRFELLVRYGGIGI